MKRRIGLGVFGVLVVAAVGLVWVAAQHYRTFLDTPLAVGGAGQIFELAPGTSYRGMVRRLAVAGLTTGAWPWRLYGRLERPVVQSGEYFIAPGMTPRQWLDRVRRGEVVVHHFTVVEGWTLAQLRKALAATPAITPCSADWDDARLAAALEHAPERPLEGRFLPATYDYTRGVCDLEILRRAYRAMAQALAEAWAGRTAGVPYLTADELLTLASIVEKESALSEERSRIAGVYVRRLERGMRLQADPTVIYGLGAGFDGNLRRADLRRDQPYNTYTRGGLPPGPIALPGRGALEAAAQPAAGDSLYFVASGGGGHAFAATLAEHERNVDRYQRAPARRTPVVPPPETAGGDGGEGQVR